MPLTDKIQRLDEQIRAMVDKAVHDLRQQLLDRLQSHQRQLQEHLQDVSLDLPEHLLLETHLDTALEEAAQDAAGQAIARGRLTAFAELKAALSGIDEAQGQGEILRALLEGAALFASRTAFFLAAPGRLSGWGGNGFGEAEAALRGLELNAAGGNGWARLLAGRGAVRLSTGDRADLSSRLEIPIPSEAALLPLVLRDRVAGALYGDRSDEASPPLCLDALQVLTYTAGLALETLPLRRRGTTPTLAREDGAGPGLPVWGAATEAAAGEVIAEAAETQAETEVEIEEAEAAETPVGGVALEEAPTEPPEIDLEAAELEIAALPQEEEVSLEDLRLEEPALELEEEEAEIDLEAPRGEIDLEAPEAEIELELAENDRAWQAEAEAAAPETELPEELGAPPPPVSAVPPGEAEEALEAAPAPEAPPPAAPPPPRPWSESREETRPGVAPPSPVPPAAPLSAAESTGQGAEVAPPSDVEGPGWAFKSPSRSLDGDEEALHEEARRLARLLVSEIKLYNEESVLEGRRNHDISERLRDDIERSRQLYDARVDAQVREKTDYFYQEMVRILGAGDPKTLGI